MKKRLLFLPILPILLISSCGGSSSSTFTSSSTKSDSTSKEQSESIPSEEETSSIDSSSNIPDPEEVTKFKELLHKQDISPFYTRVFSITYNQQYSFFSYESEDMSSVREFYNYSGSGIFGYGYSLDEQTYIDINQKENPNAFDYMSRGSYGHYELMQAAHLATFNSSDPYSRDYATVYQSVASDFYDDRFQVVNDLSYISDNFPEKSFERSLNAVTTKEILFNSATTDTLNDIFNQTVLYDGPGMTQKIDAIYYVVLADLMNKNDEELAHFIANNNIEMNVGDVTIEVNFNLNDDNIKQLLEEVDIIPGVFAGTLIYDKETGEFNQFSYTIYEANVSEDEDSINVSSVNFLAGGFSTHDDYDPSGSYIAPDPVTYDDGDQFIDDIVENLIPPFDIH